MNKNSNCSLPTRPVVECLLSTLLRSAVSGGRVKTWKRRWFILTDNCLYYFEYTTVSVGPLPSVISAQGSKAAPVHQVVTVE